MSSRSKSTKTQSEKFKEAARELGCDNNEEAVDELMKRVASSQPPRKKDNQKQDKGESPLSKTNNTSRVKNVDKDS